MTLPIYRIKVKIKHLRNSMKKYTFNVAGSFNDYGKQKCITDNI